ncbi:bifunctional UDP-sugar hydrolase/5'-nucleotidase UshA [Sansalvadorimonas sp. 2012CJ34-2]|uniref:Bifunctional UDP-sugar hydrolase/5'-nucleotidase UshA n=1 Tax=Parendozoicomonas callyspongiae TaxID=2942213 RepID=A0ABT0PK67_9GAMM|nr:bifunctional UDP-sugar hydrolase/5'-nucleotidase UshA [Sansalvadorimonas sp. 2012CJ34-2]MCL6271754.1 bifunctional UDP-sugar hydrolase/5'-nucleotidase UshA [Sansalvadorimonas sp. 2012CJ34-2]
MRVFYRFRYVCLLSCALFLAACALEPPRHQGLATCDGKPHKLTLLHTNDNHGHFWRNSKGEGGMAARKTLIDQIRKEVEAEGGSVLVLSGGDINTGVPTSDMLDALPDIQGMNLIGYNASAVGNHEFDNPLPVLMQQAKWANFPFLAANIYVKKTGKRLFQPYVILKSGDLKIAVIGLTTLDTVTTSNPEVVKDFDFKDPVKEAKALVPELKRKADIIIAATHLGWYFRGQHGVNSPGDYRLANEVDGIDIIAGGHSQDPLFRPDVKNSTYIMQAFEWGKYVGRADFIYKDGILKLTEYRLLPVNLKKKIYRDGKKTYVYIDKKIPEDKAMLELLEPYQKKGEASLSVQVGSTDGRLPGERAEVRFHETALGRLIATAQKERAKADFAVINSGGIRTSIAEGPITYRDVLKVQPFGNQVAYWEATGKDIKNYLQVVGSMPPDSGAFAHFVGVEMVVEDGMLKRLHINGKKVDNNKTYRMAVNSFSAAGGDAYPKIDDKPGFVNLGFIDAEVLKEYIQKNSPIRVAKFKPRGEVQRN